MTPETLAKINREAEERYPINGDYFNRKDEAGNLRPPVKEESQDELWDDLIREIENDARPYGKQIPDLKSRFTITRKTE